MGEEEGQSVEGAWGRRRGGWRRGDERGKEEEEGAAIPSSEGNDKMVIGTV